MLLFYIALVRDMDVTKLLQVEHSAVQWYLLRPFIDRSSTLTPANEHTERRGMKSSRRRGGVFITFPKDWRGIDDVALFFRPLSACRSGPQ